ncbi:MAG: pitrilysin family protein [Synechococcaceae cyanobacterium]|nr:pitrilysin family protein [Synechococcaceae cyanobacterium]
MSAPPVSCVLSGGLPLWVVPRPGPAILAARLIIPGGSGADPAGARGIHQLLAGVMTRGCGDLDAEALADLVEGAGAALRADAQEDSLTVSLKCAADDAAALLPLLLRMVRRPVLADDQVELERQLNLQTLQRQREDPFQLAHDRLRHLLYGNGPYGHDPLGVEEEILALAPHSLAPLVEGLGGRGAVLVLSGDAPAAGVDLLEEELGRCPWPTAAPQGEPTPGGVAAAERLGSQELNTEQLVLMLGATTVPLGHADALPLRLLQDHLGVGMSSRLFVVMREERGLAYDVGVHMPSRCGPAPWVMHLATSAERAEEATTCLLEEWQRLLETPLRPQELQLALAKFRGQEAMGRQTCGQIADRTALLLSHGLNLQYLEGALLRAETLNTEALLAAARRWLAAPALSLVGPPEAVAAAERAWRRHPLSGVAPAAPT